MKLRLTFAQPLFSLFDDEQVNQSQAGENAATTVLPGDNLEMEPTTIAPTTGPVSTGEHEQSSIIPACYVDASIPPEAQIAAPTPAGLGIYLSNLQVLGHHSLMIKAQVMDVDSPLLG